MREDSRPASAHGESFVAKLEDRARRILEEPAGAASGRWSPTFSTEEAVALVMHQLEEVRVRGRMVLASLLQDECYVGTELRQMEDRVPRYSPYRFPEREKLQRRLGHLAQERRRFTVTHGEKIDALHEMLLSLLGKHRQLGFHS